MGAGLAQLLQWLDYGLALLGKRIFLYSQAPTPTLGPAQLYIQWTVGVGDFTREGNAVSVWSWSLCLM